MALARRVDRPLQPSLRTRSDVFPIPIGSRAPRTPVRQALAPVIDRMRSRAKARGVRIAGRVADDVGAVIDAHLLQDVVGTLLDNALASSCPGDIVEIECAPREGIVMLSVADQGPARADHARGTIFGSDEGRAHGLRRRAPGNSGLAFCREVALAHGGDAWTYNRQRGGTCYVFEVKSATEA